MNITFILGNGFDRQIGLDTSYSDFLKVYLNRIDDDKDIQRFKEDIANQKENGMWSDAEIELGKYVKNFSDDNVNTFINLKQHFESELRNYLIDQQNRCDYTNFKSINSGFSDFILNSYNDVMNRRIKMVQPNNENNEYNFITFNYTNIIYKLVECLSGGNKEIRHRLNNTVDYLGRIVSVHGQLDTAPILGVNDISQIDLSGGVTITDELRWNLIKPDLNAESGYRWDSPAKTIINQSDIIYIYGVSFGITDNLWWDHIRDWLDASVSHRIVWFKWDELLLDTHNAAQELSYEKNFRIELLNKLKYNLSELDCKKYFNQLFIIHNTNRLNLKEYLIAK